ncbi:hypothetical protein LCGC14_2298660 [marine sediment metagenome]|uniref:Uncharacterized protein n=1 Tax=marine sediment metagenome TaxID=412755 RepID=A0A0F9CP19_9ZZZZ
MNWKTIKKIYIEVLVRGAKIEYFGEDKYRITSYHSNGNKKWSDEYKENILHGKTIHYLNSGEFYIHNYLNGKHMGYERSVR